jgi:hypothetical protein
MTLIEDVERAVACERRCDGRHHRWSSLPIQDIEEVRLIPQNNRLDYCDGSRRSWASARSVRTGARVMMIMAKSSIVHDLACLSCSLVRQNYRDQFVVGRCQQLRQG